MPKVIASVALIAASCWVSSVSGQRTADKKETGDSCIIKMSVFIPGFKKAIEKETAAGSKVRKAALQALADPGLKKGSFTLTPKGGGTFRAGVSRNLKTEPASGEVVIDGITWKWQTTADLPRLQFELDYGDFNFRPRFTISTASKVPGKNLVQVPSDDTYENLFYVVAGGGNGRDGTKVPKNARTPKPSDDTCKIPMSLFIPSFKKAIEKRTPAKSMIRKAALQALADPKLQKGTFKLLPRAYDFRFGISGTIKIEPTRGEVVSDGITWKWEISAFLGDGETYSDLGFTRIHFSPHFAIRAIGALPDPFVVHVASGNDTRNRWFYLVGGGGKEQDATKVPKNAPPGK